MLINSWSFTASTAATKLPTTWNPIPPPTPFVHSFYMGISFLFTFYVENVKPTEKLNEYLFILSTITNI